MRIKIQNPYQAISLHKEFVEEVKKYVRKSGKYQSIADFTREAVREKMERIDLCKKEP